jgi:hypothetical protein
MERFYQVRRAGQRRKPARLHATSLVENQAPDQACFGELEAGGRRLPRFSTKDLTLKIESLIRFQRRHARRDHKNVITSDCFCSPFIAIGKKAASRSVKARPVRGGQGTIDTSPAQDHAPQA